MARKDIHKDGVKTQFSSTNQPENSGRRPSVFAKYIRENRVSLDDLRALISSLIGYDADEIQEILKNKKNKPPIGIILLLKAIMKDFDKGETTNFDKLMDRTFGKPEKTINHDFGAIDPKTLSMLSAAFIEAPKLERKTRTKPKEYEQKTRAK